MRVQSGQEDLEKSKKRDALSEISSNCAFKTRLRQLLSDTSSLLKKNVEMFFNYFHVEN